ncbi:MAG: acyltransferase family protein [Candidatus Levyibacteriota bacterium]|jgi:fucose 4-O-acetylase-like acetyltransferase
MQTERVHWIDISRGIGIIFIIYAHMLGSHDFRYLFYAFHIPLFFFLSGLVYDHKKYGNFFTFLKKSAKRLLVPYFIFAFIFYVLWLVGLKTYNLFSPAVIKQFLSIFYGNSNNGLMVFNDVLWFLPTLFVTRILFAVVAQLFSKTRSLIFVLLCFSVFGYLLSVFASNIKLPFGAETAISAVVFYGVGFLWNNSEKAKSLLFKYKYLLFVLLLIVGAFVSTIDFNTYGQQIDMRLGHLNNYFSFYIAAFSGIFAWISFSVILNKNSLLEKIGRNSLILFAWHPLVFTYFGIILNAVLGLSLIRNIKLFIPLIYTVTSIAVILAANSFYNKLKLAFIFRYNRGRNRF